MNRLESRLEMIIRENGPLDVGTFMGIVVAHYYAARDPFGAEGDFTTAPEISQMFGEMLGVCLADVWMQMGAPAPVALVEGGPGRGSLMADILRATRHVPGFHAAVQVHLIETSALLRTAQKESLSSYAVHWHDNLDGIPDQMPVLFVANELLDALPMRQYQYADGAWHERMIGLDDDGRFAFGLVPVPPGFVEGASPGEDGKILERSPAREHFIRDLSSRIKKQNGFALLIDYGSDRSGFGDTLQAMRRHQFVDVLDDIGNADLTSHVDFESVARVAADYVTVRGPIGQGKFLQRLGIDMRAGHLSRAGASGVDAALQRLTHPEQMGTLFRVVALCGKPEIQPAGF